MRLVTRHQPVTQHWVAAPVSRLISPDSVPASSRLATSEDLSSDRQHSSDLVSPARSVYSSSFDVKACVTPKPLGEGDKGCHNPPCSILTPTGKVVQRCPRTLGITLCPPHFAAYPASRISSKQPLHQPRSWSHVRELSTRE